MNQPIKNYGFSPALEQKHRDRVRDKRYGATSKKGIGDMAIDLREAYLPKGEVQVGKDDMADCASRGPLNILEAKFTYSWRNGLFSDENMEWLRDKQYVVFRDGKPCVEFSDAFVAINSGTTRTGNSLKAPCQSIRAQGTIPKKMLPLESWMTWEQYHDPDRITSEMERLGEEWKDRFEIEYEQVEQRYWKALLAGDFFDVALFAWPEPQDGEYPAVIAAYNHVVAIIKPEYFVFDNYEETKNDFIKKLAPNYSFYSYGYRIYIAQEHDAQEIQERRQAIFATMQRILLLCRKLLEKYSRKLGKYLA